MGSLNYSLRVFLNTAISGPYGQYFLVSKNDGINSPEHEEKLNFKEFNSGWLYLTGKTALVQLDGRYSTAKVDFGSGITADCRAQ